MALTQKTAETVALSALTWIVSDIGRLRAFENMTGLGENDLRAKVDDPELLAATLDFLLTRDEWIVGFCDACGHSYETPMQARSSLPGGRQVHWT